MPPIVPHRFLVRVCHPVPFVSAMPDTDGKHLVDLPETARLNTFAELDEVTTFADVRIAWNEFGLGIQAVVSGKKETVLGNATSPRSSDGLTVWIDTRSDRTSHRASRFCHQFHFLPNGGGTDLDEPILVQTKINRALQDAPLCNPADVPFRAEVKKNGYRLEAFLPAGVLSGFDPEQHPRLGFYYVLRDMELGDQFLSVNGDFPFSDDPSLWASLELIR
jgi:hypothetical protein